MANKSRPSTLPVYLYIPNIIGYIRIVMNCVAFAICFSEKRLFSLLYIISFVCGCVGWLVCPQVQSRFCATWRIEGFCVCACNCTKGPQDSRVRFGAILNSRIYSYLSSLSHMIGAIHFSTFGAVLDMVTDRISTACLLVILSQVYRPGLIFLSLLALDIASHWLQMYSTFLVGKASHKDVNDSTSWLFKAYYGNRLFMGSCCLSCELLYIGLFLVAKTDSENLAHVLVEAWGQSLVYSMPLSLIVFGWAIKQSVNVIQMKTAADLCVVYDINKKQKQEQ